MKKTHVALSLLAVSVGLGLMTGAQAQSSTYQQTTTNSAYPSTTTTTTTTTRGNTTQMNVTSPTATTTTTMGNTAQMNVTPPVTLAGEAQKSGWRSSVEHKNLTVEPGAGQFTIKSLGKGDTMVLDLYNPSNVPLVFETTQNGHHDASVVVPANGHANLAYEYGRRASDEVKFLVYQEPANAVAAINQNIMTANAAAAQTTAQETTVTETQAESVQQIVPAVQPEERSSAVRGYW